MSVETIARRYSSALADVVVARGEHLRVRDELSAWEKMITSSRELLEVFRNPTIPYDQKRGVLDALIKRTRVSQMTENFLRVLLQNHRLADLQLINVRFVEELDKRAGMVSAQVTTARSVSTSEQEALRQRLASLTGSNVRLEFDVDAELIGGVVTRIGSTIYDGSVRSQLQQIKEKMIGAQTQ